MLAIPQMGLPKICQETHSPAQLPSRSAHPAPATYSRCRSVSYTCRSHVADVLNALLQRQHLVIARYAATARDSRPFARCIVPAQSR